MSLIESNGIILKTMYFHRTAGALGSGAETCIEREFCVTIPHNVLKMQIFGIIAET